MAILIILAKNSTFITAQIANIVKLWILIYCAYFSNKLGLPKF